MSSENGPGIVTLLFTDIEGSSRLWEEEPERMPRGLACHDELLRRAVSSHRGVVVKMIGDGMCAAFDDPCDGLEATLALQQKLADPEATNGLALRVRCGLHAGSVEHRDNDVFGSVVNRAARIMRAAHGGQVLISAPVTALLGDRLPSGVGLRDLGSVRLRDLAAPERVYQVTHPQLQPDFPVLRSLENTPNNLPQQMTSFVGRERQLADVKNLLATTRLLTLLGVGGIGKTRLSLQAAADAMDAYPDGVWLVELAPLTDSRLVAQAVASVLGVREAAGRPVLEALLKHVKDQRLLLIVDNCEHVLHACAELAKQLLQSGPHLKIIATSRERLNLAGEKTYVVPALAMPQPNQYVLPGALTQYEAVRLFIDRAAALQPAFRVTDQNAGAMADICQHLDGIPLAIELAAARARALSLEKIAERLSDRFRLLTRGDQTALPRQRTLRALIDWSYDLLTEHERLLFRRLAVFAGGWTLEAAEAVGMGGDVEAVDVLDPLTELVEKSLVTLEAEGGRYRLLETMREYAQERLIASGERDRVRARHLAFYLAFAEKARPELQGTDQAAWFTRLDLERENLLAAHAWCGCTEDGGEPGLRLVTAVRHYWIHRGGLELGQRVTLEALARAAAQERSLARCRGLSAAAVLESCMGHYVQAQAYLEEGLSIAREAGDTESIAKALWMLGDQLYAQGKRREARAHIEEALPLARQLGQKSSLGTCLATLADLNRLEGDLDAAEPLFQESLTLAREVGELRAIIVGLLNLASVSMARGNAERPREMMLEALAIIEQIGSKPLGVFAVLLSAGLAALVEEWERAGRLNGAAIAQYQELGLHPEPADKAFLSPLIAGANKTLGKTAFARAEAAGRVLSYEQAVAEARAWLEARS